MNYWRQNKPRSREFIQTTSTQRWSAPAATPSKRAPPSQTCEPTSAVSATRSTPVSSASWTPRARSSDSPAGWKPPGKTPVANRNASDGSTLAGSPVRTSSPTPQKPPPRRPPRQSNTTQHAIGKRGGNIPAPLFHAPDEPPWSGLQGGCDSSRVSPLVVGTIRAVETSRILTAIGYRAFCASVAPKQIDKSSCAGG